MSDATYQDRHEDERTAEETALVKEFFRCTDFDDFFTFEDLMNSEKREKILGKLFNDFLDEEKG